VCHLTDNTSLYLELLRAILAGENPGSGKQGYYLAASGSTAWADIYDAVAASLVKQGVIDDATIREATIQDLNAMGAALRCPKEFVPFQLGGL